MSLASDWAISPMLADNMAFTSVAVLSITARFKFLKSASWSDAWPRARSRDWISLNFDEHIQRRYASLAVAQNWSIHVKYASRHVLYPVPNVFDCVAFSVNVARAGVVAAREMVVALRGAVWFVVARECCIFAALRAMVFEVRAVRAGVVAVRVADCFVLVVRETTRFFVLRAPVVFVD